MIVGENHIIGVQMLYQKIFSIIYIVKYVEALESADPPGAVSREGGGGGLLLSLLHFQCKLYIS